MTAIEGLVQRSHPAETTATCTICMCRGERGPTLFGFLSFVNPHGVQSLYFVYKYVVCFIIGVYKFFFIYPKRMEVKRDNMPHVGHIVTSEGHIVT